METSSSVIPTTILHHQISDCYCSVKIPTRHPQSLSPLSPGFSENRTREEGTEHVVSDVFSNVLSEEVWLRSSQLFALHPESAVAALFTYSYVLYEVEWTKENGDGVCGEISSQGKLHRFRSGTQNNKKKKPEQTDKQKKSNQWEPLPRFSKAALIKWKAVFVILAPGTGTGGVRRARCNYCSPGSCTSLFVGMQLRGVASIVMGAYDYLDCVEKNPTNVIAINISLICGAPVPPDITSHPICEDECKPPTRPALSYRTPLKKSPPVSRSSLPSFGKNPLSQVSAAGARIPQKKDDRPSIGSTPPSPCDKKSCQRNQSGQRIKNKQSPTIPSGSRRTATNAGF
ncbi:hypothetical protein GEV33_011791 [Tenebrio molitor]|uniref:Uncharacterized protein n=1 Tax=Tenebrio molitor TaxID=7067 RepID=A0A8J6H399_TENMO|nr:hypothetical protein GEV33_011791 [Tenebrio molitor]